MRSHRCRRADSVSFRYKSLSEANLRRLSGTGRSVALALGLLSTAISVIGSEGKTAATPSEHVFDHRFANEKQPPSSGETIPLADSASESAAQVSTMSRLERALHPSRTFLPTTFQRFAATMILGSSVFDILARERELTLAGRVGSDAAGTSLPRHQSLFLLNYPVEQRTRAKFGKFAGNAATDMSGIAPLRPIPFEHQAVSRPAILPDLFHLVPTSAFGTNAPVQHAAALAEAQKSVPSALQSPSDLLPPAAVATPEAGFEKRDWHAPARAAAAYASTALLVANAVDSSPSDDALARPDSPGLALSSEVLSSHLTFGANGARLSGNGTITGDVVLDPSLGIAPGNSPGLLTVAGGLTWSEGGFFELEIQDPASERGTGWDAIHVNGILQFTATLGTPFTVHLSSLTESGASGNISNFLAARPYALQVLTATGGINGFNPAAVRITTTGFTNALDGGSFALLASGNDLMLTFTPVPEPSTWALMLTGASVLAMKLMRRRRRA